MTKIRIKPEYTGVLHVKEGNGVYRGQLGGGEYIFLPKYMCEEVITYDDIKVGQVFTYGVSRENWIKTYGGSISDDFLQVVDDSKMRTITEKYGDIKVLGHAKVAVE